MFYLWVSYSCKWSCAEIRYTFSPLVVRVNLESLEDTLSMISSTHTSGRGEFFSSTRGKPPWRAGTRPVEWKIGLVAPMFKKGDPPWESLFQDVGEDCPTSGSGGAVWFSPSSWSSGPDLYPCSVTKGGHVRLSILCLVDSEQASDHVPEGFCCGCCRSSGYQSCFGGQCGGQSKLVFSSLDLQRALNWRPSFSARKG